MSKRVKLDFAKYYKNSYYPSQESSLQASLKYKNNNAELPLQELLNLSQKKDGISSKSEEYVVHWFRKDLRTVDNTSFTNCVRDCSESGQKLIGLYVISTKFWRNHYDSPWKINLIERRLKELEKNLNQLNIPLTIAYLDDANKNDIKFDEWFKSLMKDRFNSKSVYFNVVYDYDEIKRDISLFNQDLNISLFHDECIVQPLTLKTGKGDNFKKFTPWFKKWAEHTSKNPIKIDNIEKLPEWDWSHLESDKYDLDPQFQLNSLAEFGTTTQDIEKFKTNYKVDDKFIESKLEQFIKLKIKSYQNDKSFLFKSSTSQLSSYITIGALSTRYIIFKIQSIHKSENLSIKDFIKEVAWRDFYKDVLISNPYLQFDLPYNYNSLDLEYQNDSLKFQKWCLGQTGYPIIDSSMRELLHTGYLSNRSRMIVSNFLTKDLLIDWRWGMNWFHERLIDGDYSSNHGGWTWISSTGVDCQPWFRSFNWKTQSEKCDPNGDFITQWCNELKNYDKKLVHVGDDDAKISVLLRDEIMDIYRDCMGSSTKG